MDQSAQSWLFAVICRPCIETSMTSLGKIINIFSYDNHHRFDEASKNHIGDGHILGPGLPPNEAFLEALRSRWHVFEEGTQETSATSMM